MLYNRKLNYHRNSTNNSSNSNLHPNFNCLEHFQLINKLRSYMREIYQKIGPSNFHSIMLLTILRKSKSKLQGWWRYLIAEKKIRLILKIVIGTKKSTHSMRQYHHMHKIKRSIVFLINLWTSQRLRICYEVVRTLEY